MVTDRQKRAVSFCERWLKIKFEGDINNYDQVSAFLSQHLEDAEDIYDEAACDFMANEI